VITQGLPEQFHATLIFRPQGQADQVLGAGDGDTPDGAGDGVVKVTGVAALPAVCGDQLVLRIDNTGTTGAEIDLRVTLP
jgi:hypothetical protein